MWGTFMGGVYKIAMHLLPKSFFITGCNRGIGFELVKQLAKNENAPQHLFATFRNHDTAEDLKKLADEYPCIHLIRLDVQNFNSFAKVMADVSKIVGEDGLNVLINNAGISPKFTRIGMVKSDAMMETFSVNTVAPILLVKEMLPLLKMAANKNKEKPFGISRAAVINISSILGSMEKNTEGGYYPYRCSKAALNSATRSMCYDLTGENIMVVSLHPGWVKTRLGGSKAPMSPEESISGIVNIMQFLSHEHNGQFVQYDGRIVPW